MLRTLAEETPERIGPHPGDDHIVAYYARVLPADEMEPIEDHLVFCRNCATELLALAAFCASDRVEIFSSALNTFTNLPSK